MNRFVIADSTVCIGCRTCEAACAETHRQHGLQAMPRLHLMRNEKESAPQMCHHCEDAPCAAVCPVNAINRVDGAVQLNESLCVSCKLCGIACPFGAIEFSGSRPLDMPANANTPWPPPRRRRRPASARCSTGCRACALSPLNATCATSTSRARLAFVPARPTRCCWWISAISPRPASVSGS